MTHKEDQEAAQKYLMSLSAYDPYYENDYCQSNYSDVREAFLAGAAHGRKVERERIIKLLRTDEAIYKGEYQLMWPDFLDWLESKLKEEK